MFGVGLRPRMNEHKIRHLTTTMDGEIFEFIDMKELPTHFHNVFVIDTLNTLQHMKDYPLRELRTYKHPEDALYIFGEDTSNLAFHQEVINSGLKGDVVYISLPTKRMLHQLTACAFILYDRYYKETLQYTNKQEWGKMILHDISVQQSTGK